MKLGFIAPFVVFAAVGVGTFAWNEMKKHGPAAQCIESIRKKNDTPEQRVSKCQGGLAQIDEIFERTEKNTDAHGVNLYRVTRAIMQDGIAGGYAKLDGKASARVCAMEEAAWVDIAALEEGVSPAGFEESYELMRKKIVPALAKCREAFGAPPNAPALPN